jgi:hypothetical protein
MIFFKNIFVLVIIVPLVIFVYYKTRPVSEFPLRNYYLTNSKKKQLRKLRGDIKVSFTGGSETDSELERNYASTNINYKTKKLVYTRDHKIADLVVYIRGDDTKARTATDITFSTEPYAITGSKGAFIRRPYAVSRFMQDKPIEFFTSMTTSPFKRKKVSAILSSKVHTSLGKKRIKFIEKLSRLIDIDVYGRGHSKDSFNGQYKGPLENRSDAFMDYEYTICIENSVENNYVTEKFTDPLFCWCSPIYFGCPNIKSIYPDGGYTLLGDDWEKDTMNALKLSINYEDLSHSRNKSLYDYNIWSYIYNEIYE